MKKESLCDGLFRQIRNTRFCCGQQMVWLNSVDFLHNNLINLDLFICVKCGRIIKVADTTPDYEELKSWKELYLEELKELKLE